MEFERIRTFIRSFDKDETELMKKIREDAEERDIPIVRTDTADFLNFLIELTKPKSLLEVGMAVGYSTLLFAKGISSIDTCENDPLMIKEAKSNFEAAGVSNSIRVIEGDAEETMKSLDGPYDMIFIDAAKAQYAVYMEEAIRMSHPGTLIVCDNVFGEGLVLESHFLVEKRDRTIHDRMRNFLEHVKEDDRMDSHILSIGDGMTVSIVK